jgi:hypothetical protein
MPVRLTAAPSTGYHHATPDTMQRRFLSTGGTITNRGSEWRQRPLADRIEDNEGARSRRLPADSHADRSVRRTLSS